VTPEGTTGVLVMAHGTPEKRAGIEAFYTRIRRGRPASPDQLAELEGRYEAIGGVSPLARRTAAQVEALSEALERTEPGRYVVAFGAKHAEPLIEDAARSLASSGVRRVVGLVLTPHRSSMGSGEYLSRAATALAECEHPPAFVAVDQWYDAPGFVELLAERVRAQLGAPEAVGAGRPIVLFTAHSLPEAVLAHGDPYVTQMTDSAELIAAAAGLGSAGVDWQVAWQSAGRTEQTWIGPDVLEVLRALPARGYSTVVVCPVGFVADHLEVLYDLDIEASQVAHNAGLVFSRTASLNDDPAFIEVLASTVRRVAEGEDVNHQATNRAGAP